MSGHAPKLQPEYYPRVYDSPFKVKFNVVANNSIRVSIRVEDVGLGTQSSCTQAFGPLSHPVSTKSKGFTCP